MFEREVLVAGLGSIGERHVRNLLALGQEDITVLRRQERPPRTLDGDEFLTVTDVERAFGRDPAALIVATPTALHKNFLERAVRETIPTLVEVPLAASLEGLDEIARSAETTGTPVLMGHNLRFHPALERIRTAVEEGEIGIPLYSRAQFGEFLPDCHPWEDFRERYEARADLGGGVILTSIHEIDHAIWLFGPVEAVTCVARTRRHDIDVEDVAMLVLEHEGGVMSEIVLDFVQRTYRRSLQIAGEEGTIEWELLGDDVRKYSASADEWRPILEYAGYDINETYMDELRHFARMAAGEEAPRTDLRAGIHALNVALSALHSSADGARVEVTEATGLRRPESHSPK